jgi:hypothetical protein
MKKLFKLLAVLALACTTAACGKNESVALDMEKIPTAIESVKSDKFDRVNAAFYLSMNENMGSVIEYYEWDLETLGINKDNIYFDESQGFLDFSMGEDTELGTAFFVGKAANETLKTELDTYFSKFANVKKEEFNGYLVYIACADNEAAYKDFTNNGYTPVMNGLMYLTAEDLEFLLGLTSDKVAEFVVGYPSFMTSASQVIVLKAAEGQETAVKEAMTTYMTNLQQQWDMYLPDQAELVRNHVETTIGDYLVYIVSSNNNAVLEAIESCAK